MSKPTLKLAEESILNFLDSKIDYYQAKYDNVNNPQIQRDFAAVFVYAYQDTRVALFGEMKSKHS